MTQNPTKGIKQLCGVPFLNVSGTEIDIQSLRPTNNGADPDDGSFKIWWYDTSKMAYVYAQYCPYGVADDGNVQPEEELNGTLYEDDWYWVTEDDNVFILAPLGWKHDAEALATIVDHQKLFATGEAFWVSSNDAKPYLHFVNPFYTAAE